MKPFLVGLTGSIGTGKSTALNQFNALGITTFSADLIARKLRTSKKAQNYLTTHFPTLNLKPNHALRDFFEKNPKALATWSSWLQPQIWQAFQQDHQKISPGDSLYVVFEVPLLFEVNWNRNMDRTLLIRAPESIILARLTARQLSLQAIKTWLDQQMPEDQKAQIAQDIIDNNGDLDQLKDQVIKLDLLYRNLASKT